MRQPYSPVNLNGEEGTLSFSAQAGSGEEAHTWAVELAFMHPVNAKDSKISVGPRNVVVMVMKTEEVGRRDSDTIAITFSLHLLL